MAQARRRKKPAQKTAGGVGLGWWITGVAAVGWIVHASNPGLVDGVVKRWQAPVESASRASPARQQAKPRQQAAAARPAPTQEPQNRPSATVPPTPQRQVAALPAAVPALPVKRPPATIDVGRDSAGANRRTAVTTARVQLRSEPSTTSGVRTTLDAGRPLRVVDSKGDWRRVEAGIFIGWVHADYLSTGAARTAMSPPALKQAQTSVRAPVPPATVSGTPR